MTGAKFNRVPTPEIPALNLVDQACIDTLTDQPRAPIPLHPQDEQAIAEVLQRFGPDAPQGRRPKVPRTETSAGRLSEQIEGYVDPPLPYLLLTSYRFSHQFKGKEQTLGEFATLGRVRRAGESKLHRAVSRRVDERHGVRYVDNPVVQGDDRALAAWMLTWSLERICHEDQVRPGCESLAENLTWRLLDLYSRRLMISMEEPTPDGPRPAGIELLDLCVALQKGRSIGRAAEIFTANTEENSSQRRIAARKALHVANPSSMPTQESLDTMLPSSVAYRRHVLLDADQLEAQISQAEAMLTIPGSEHDLDDGAVEDLVHLTCAIRERRDASRWYSEERREFASLYDQLINRYGTLLTGHVQRAAPAIQEGSAPYATAQFAHNILFGERRLVFQDSTLENALVRAACRWYQQPSPEEFTAAIRGSRRGTSFSQMEWPMREGYELLVKAYLFEAAEIARYPAHDPIATRIQKVRRHVLNAALPKRHHQRSQLWVQLPPAARALFNG